jgi:4-hydroxybenzoate polyprenyltransferase
MKLPPILRAVRPHQWVKNVFVLAAVVFARGDRTVPHPEDYSDVWNSVLAFFAFCLGSSSIYLINDVLDVESDRRHPEKKKRPIASGELSVPAALIASAACIVGALTLATLSRPDLSVTWVVAGYTAMNFAYSIKLKHIVLVDAFCIAVGFLFRVEAGGLAADYKVSHWLMLCTLFLALFLALCKRRAEIDLLGDDSGSHRANLEHYNRGFLDQMVTLLAATTIVCYTMYTVAPATVAKFGGGNLIYTVPFVVFGLGRYLLLVQTQKGGGSPTKVLLGGDLMFVGNALAWAGVVAWVVWF